MIKKKKFNASYTSWISADGTELDNTEYTHKYDSFDDLFEIKTDSLKIEKLQQILPDNFDNWQVFKGHETFVYHYVLSVDIGKSDDDKAKRSSNNREKTLSGRFEFSFSEGLGTYNNKYLMIGGIVSTISFGAFIAYLKKDSLKKLVSKYVSKKNEKNIVITN